VREPKLETKEPAKELLAKEKCESKTRFPTLLGMVPLTDLALSDNEVMTPLLLHVNPVQEHLEDTFPQPQPDRPERDNVLVAEMKSQRKRFSTSE
jgi:hypothetical protein